MSFLEWMNRPTTSQRLHLAILALSAITIVISSVAIYYVGASISDDGEGFLTPTIAVISAAFTFVYTLTYLILRARTTHVPHIASILVHVFLAAFNFASGILLIADGTAKRNSGFSCLGRYDEATKQYIHFDKNCTTTSLAIEGLDAAFLFMTSLAGCVLIVIFSRAMHARRRSLKSGNPDV